MRPEIAQMFLKMGQLMNGAAPETLHSAEQAVEPMRQLLAGYSLQDQADFLAVFPTAMHQLAPIIVPDPARREQMLSKFDELMALLRPLVYNEHSTLVQ